MFIGLFNDAFTIEKVTSSYKMIMNKELSRIRIEGIVPHFKSLLQGLRKNEEDFTQNSRSPDRDSNPGPAIYETELVTAACCGYETMLMKFILELCS
jgi:hypothetical protein